MAEYTSEGLYLQSKTTIPAKIAAIESIIDALELTAASSAGSENISEYWLDDGQTKIKTVYRGLQSIYDSITAFERLKQRYINRYNGRMVRLVDGKNFQRNTGNR